MNRNRRKRFVTTGLVLLTAWLIQGCSAAPRHQLTAEEKTADLMWLFSQFKENYAPLVYKQQKHNFEYEALKARYLEESKQTKNNEEFYLLMHRFVAEFKDAHTASSLLSANLPNRAKVAYLGFDGVRHRGSLIVRKLLPTISATSSFPIKVGDEITKVDGVALVDIVKKDLMKYRNLGQEESNLTYHIPKIFNRNSLSLPLPQTESAALTIKRGAKETTVTLPWIVKDLYTFTKEQAAAAAATKKPVVASEMYGSLDESAFFKLGFAVLSGEKKISPSLIQKISRDVPGFHFQDSFFFVDTQPTWGSKVLSDILAEALGQKETALDELKKQRAFNDTYIVINPNAAYPTYISAEKVLDKDGKATGAVKQVAYMYLNTFSPAGGEEVVLKEVATTLKTLKTFGVKDIVIDMINNGGGSLTLGIRLAQLFSTSRITPPEIQFKVSETWMDDFENKSISAPSDAEREIARRVFDGLSKDQAHNDSLSRKWDYESLSPFKLQANSDLDTNFNVYLLVNEMCASMCDIFTATLKDNGLATVVGTKTMGAGGNVVAHSSAPNSHLMVNQTESLIVRKDGSYIENNGVEPDVAIKVVDYANEKYEAIRKKAIELIVKQK